MSRPGAFYARTYLNSVIKWIWVELVYNSRVVISHPLFRGRFQRPDFSLIQALSVFVPCIMCQSLLSSHGHPVAVPCLSFFAIFTCIMQPPLNET